ncbi:hypothetical protein ABE10_12585 [Bacillus toyonensis]|nr:hypothetical protein [Bacillus toyonensis]
MKPTAALLYIDAAVVSLPGTSEAWIAGINDLVDHVTASRYPLETIVLTPPVLSRSTLGRIARLDADLVGTSTDSPMSRAGALARDAGVRQVRLGIAQVWWLALDPGSESRLRKRAGNLPLRILQAETRVYPPTVEDIEEVLLSWSPPEQRQPPQAAAESSLPATIIVKLADVKDLEALLAFASELALYDARLVVLAARTHPWATRLELAGIEIQPAVPVAGAPAQAARSTGTLVWVSRQAGKDSRLDRRWVPYAREVVTVGRTPVDLADWRDKVLARVRE